MIRACAFQESLLEARDPNSMLLKQLFLVPAAPLGATRTISIPLAFRLK